MQQDKQKGLLQWTIYLSLVLVWGSSFILMKKALIFFSSVEVGALRMVIAFLFLLPLAFKDIKKYSRRKWILFFLTGFVGNTVPAYLFAKAQTVIDSSLAGILNSLTPLFTLIIGILAFAFRPRWYNVAGIFVGLAGAVLLIYFSGGGFDLNMQFSTYVIVATIFYGININLVKYYLADVRPIKITIYTFFTNGFPNLLVLLFATPFIKVLQTNPAAIEGLGYIAILAVFGSALAIIAFNKLIKLSTPIFAASVTYLIPIVALMWGIVDGEHFELVFMLFIGLIIGGVYLVNKTKPLTR